MKSMSRPTFNLRTLMKMQIPYSPGTLFVCTSSTVIDCSPKSLFVSRQRYKLPLSTGLLPKQVKRWGISTCANLQSDTDFEINSRSKIDDKSNPGVAKVDKVTVTYRLECNKQEEFLVTRLQSEMTRTDIKLITNEDWNVTRNLVLKMSGEISEKNIDAVIMNKCCYLKSLSLGKSYFKYLKSTKKTINRATYGNYLLLFYSCANYCTEDDLDEIENIYKELLQVYPMLDSFTTEKVVCALSLTKHWREYEKLFNNIRKMYKPSLNIYVVVIKSAFDHNEFELGWKLMEEMQYQGTYVPDELFMHWLEKMNSRKSHENIERVLRFFTHFNLKPSNYLCEVVRKKFEECNQQSTGTFTTVARNGECRSCHNKLESSGISEQDYCELKDAFLNPVLIGRDIFQKTKPEEFSEFLDFLRKSAPFNVVLDGLNISLNTGTEKKSVNEFTFRLKSVVKHFVALNKTILVLGRKHMAKWHTQSMEYVNAKARVFLADNLSQDDPFMLYAALYSGPGTCFVSQDLMRGHKFLLANPKLQTTFQKWQASHQYFITYITNDGTVHFREPVSFLQTIQQNSHGDWHIPYIIREELTVRDKVDLLHKHWLCLQKSPPPTITFRAQKEFRSKKHKELERGMAMKKKTLNVNIKQLIQDLER